MCRNPSLGFTTKARACKGANQEGNSEVTSHVVESVGKCDKINSHTPKGAPTLGIGVMWTLKFSESDYKGQNPMD
jgi:hypothetical protein